MAPPKPIKRTTLRTVFTVIAFPICVVMMAFGTVGLIVLMDLEGTGFLSTHPIIRPLVNQSMKFLNGVMVPFCFNVGLIGIVGCLIYFFGPKHEDNMVDSAPKADSAPKESKKKN